MDKLVDFVISRISKVTANVYDTQSKSMVLTRLKRRMLELNISSPDDYLQLLESNYEQEEPILVELLTTHHTFLFREIVHFEYLQANLDKIIDKVKAQGRNTIRIWSAAASTGQEAYSLAIFLDKEIKDRFPGMNFEVVGTDIAPQSIETASKGVYIYEKVKEIPAHFLAGYWRRITEDGRDCARLENSIKSKCQFHVHNILDPIQGQDNFDIIFCRNIFIYFDDENIKKSVSNLYDMLQPHGLIFSGVSEPIGNYSSNIEKVGPCVYKRKDLVEDHYSSSPEQSKKRYNIVNVDDSPAVLKILKKIFTDDQRYNLIGQCKDGIELDLFLKSTREPVDLITLDLHMPKLDGIGYLEKNFTPSHPPVLIVSSVNRDNQELGQKAIKLGAFDYIEKPTLANFERCSEELKSKIITFLSLSKKKVSSPSLKVTHTLPSTPAPASSVTSQGLKVLPLYIFTGAQTNLNINLLLDEIFKQGYYPKHIIASTAEAKEIIFQDISRFYIMKGNKDIINQVKFSRTIDFYTSEKELLSSETRPILCLYEGTTAYSNLASFIPIEAYILSERAISHSKHHIESMPSTSWGFHVLDFFTQKKFLLDSIYSCSSFTGEIRKLKSNHSLIIFYQKDTPQFFIEVSELTNTYLNIESFIEKNKSTSTFKIVAPNIISQKLIAFLQGKGLLSLGEYHTTGDMLYTFENNHVKIKPSKSNGIIETKPQTNKIRVLVIDDSKTLTKILQKYIDQDPILSCISIHHDTKDLESDIRTKRPDVITLDMNMPDMDGAEIYEKIIKSYNIPTLLLTSSDKNSKKVLKALNSGVIDYLQKPSLNEMTNGQFPLISRIKEIAQLKSKSLELSPSLSRVPSKLFSKSLILIGASTGGTRAISYLLSSFPREVPPVIIGQHIPEHYSLAFAELLNEQNPFQVKEATHLEEIRNNMVYIAPGGCHTSIHEDRGKLIFKIQQNLATERFTPSIDLLFESASHLRHYHIVATLLTGMGKDGASSLKLLKNNGAITFAQDKESSVVYGMPKAAYEMGSVTRQVKLSSMTHEIFDSLTLLNKKVG